MADKKKTEEGAPKKKGGILKWLIILLLLLALGGGGFFAYKHFFMDTATPKDSGAQSEEAVNGSEEEDEPASEEGGVSQMLTLPPFVVNLADPLGRRYLKVSLEVELKNHLVLEKTEKSMPKIKDSLLLLLSSKSYSDLSSMEDKIALKNEIMARLGQIVGNGKVLNVYFTEFIVQ